jgi:hypothetical protein
MVALMNYCSANDREQPTQIKSQLPPISQITDPTFPGHVKVLTIVF